jgi:hypothetical protein
VTFLVNGQPRLVKVRRGGIFSVAASPGDVVEVPAGAARDRFGNRNAAAVSYSG